MPASPSAGAPLSAEELAVWRDFLRVHATITRRLESELVAEQELPLASYDVLVQLSEAPQRRLRMTELADRVLLSRSGLTRLIDRLTREGLVRREPVVDDARGMWAVLTDDGLRRLRVASVTHLRGVREHLIALFDDGDFSLLGVLLRRYLDTAERAGERVHGTPQPAPRAGISSSDATTTLSV